MTISHETSGVHFILTDSALIACNQGRPFSGGGLDAICPSNRSNKSDSPLASPNAAREAVARLREGATELYLTKAGSGLLKEQYESEKEVSRSYGARILLELLQNADDSMGTDPIGYKGLGFKCILNVTDTPRVHSGHLAVQFGRDLSANHLAASGFVASPISLPVLRIPFCCETPEAEHIVKLRDVYDTVLILPFRSEEARQRVLNEWAEIVEDPSILVFLRNIKYVGWEEGGSVREWFCRREGARVVISGGGSGPQKERIWKVVRGRNALGAAAMPVSRNAEGALPFTETPHPRAFFPIHKEHSPFPRLLIHGQFPLDPSREYVLKEPSEVSPVVQEIAEAVRTLLGDCASFGRILDLVRPRIEPSAMDGLERALWEKIRAHIADLTIPGDPSKTVEAVRNLPNEFYPKTAPWEDSAEALCQIKISTKQWLREVRPGGLADLPFLNEDWENPPRESTLRALVDQCQLKSEQFQTLLLFPVGDGSECVSPSKYFVTIRPQGGVPIIPDEVPFRCLPGEGERTLSTRKQVRDYLEKVAGLKKFEIASIIEKAVIPAMPGLDSAQLLEFLFLLTRGSAVLEKRFDWFCSWRVELAHQLRLPVRDGSSRPPIEVYAGKDWTEDEYLEVVFGDRPDRGFLLPPPNDLNDREALESFYEWIGVGFSPKVIPVPGVPALEKPEAGTRVGVKWTEGRFVLDHPPAEWDSYCRACPASGTKDVA